MMELLHVGILLFGFIIYPQGLECSSFIYEKEVVIILNIVSCPGSEGTNLVEISY